MPRENAHSPNKNVTSLIVPVIDPTRNICHVQNCVMLFQNINNSLPILDLKVFRTLIIIGFQAGTGVVQPKNHTPGKIKREHPIAGILHNHPFYKFVHFVELFQVEVRTQRDIVILGTTISVFYYCRVVVLRDC